MALYSRATLSSRLRKNNFNPKVIRAHDEYSNGWAPVLGCANYFCICTNLYYKNKKILYYNYSY